MLRATRREGNKSNKHLNNHGNSLKITVLESKLLTHIFPNMLSHASLTASSGLLSRRILPLWASHYHNYPRGPEVDRSTLIRKRREFMHGSDSGENFRLPGVSPKQFPVPIEWRRPRHFWRRLQSPVASGDGSGNPTGEQIGLSRPRAEYEGSKALEEAPEEVKRVMSLEFARNKDLMEVYGHTTKY